jgi:hypothetical protein
MARNAQLQLKVFLHTHEPIVLGRALIRSLSHSGDMSSCLLLPAPIELWVAWNGLVEAYAAMPTLGCSPRRPRARNDPSRGHARSGSVWAIRPQRQPLHAVARGPSGLDGRH